MTDRREIIRLLRAKANSTTFPGEAQALRAKADDLETALRSGVQGDEETFRQPADGAYAGMPVVDNEGWEALIVRLTTRGRVRAGWTANRTTITEADGSYSVTVTFTR